MKILIDTRVLTKGKTGGIPSLTYHLVDSLLKKDKINEYILFYNGFRKGPLPQEWVSNQKVTVINSIIPNRILNLSFRFLNWPNKHFKNADVVFSPHFDLVPETKTPHIIIFHDLSFHHYPNFFSPKQRFWHWFQKYESRGHKARHLIADSKFTKSDLIKLLNIPKEKISVIYPGLNPLFRPTNKNQKVKEKFKLNKPFWLYVGDIQPRKNLLVLIRAFKELKKKFKNYELVIAGRPGYKSNDIYKETKNIKGIRFITNPSNKELVSLYSLANVFVFPSFFEGFGFPPLEAQACDTPVVSSKRTSLTEILNDSALYFDPWRVTELVRAIEKIETDTILKKGLIKKGQENIKRFSWSKAADKVINIFQNAT